MASQWTRSGDLLRITQQSLEKWLDCTIPQKIANEFTVIVGCDASLKQWTQRDIARKVKNLGIGKTNDINDLIKEYKNGKDYILNCGKRAEVCPSRCFIHIKYGNVDDSDSAHSRARSRSRSRSREHHPHKTEISKNRKDLSPSPKPSVPSDFGVDSSDNNNNNNNKNNKELESDNEDNHIPTTGGFNGGSAMGLGARTQDELLNQNNNEYKESQQDMSDADNDDDDDDDDNEDQSGIVGRGAFGASDGFATRRRLNAIFNRKPSKQDLDEELDAYLAQRDNAASITFNGAAETKENEANPNHNNNDNASHDAITTAPAPLPSAATTTTSVAATTAPTTTTNTHSPIYGGPYQAIGTLHNQTL